MLVLTRKRSEMIQIGENITIKVIRTGRGTVKIGIEAPANVRVLRGELCGEPATPSLPEQQDSVDRDPRHFAYACSDQFPHVL